MRIFIGLIFFIGFLMGGTFRVASYNVENLFDLVKNGTEYLEYIPNNRFGWNRKIYKIKLQNIAKVIKELDADIVGLQEIESRVALKDLVNELKKQGVEYKYYTITKKKKTTVRCALISKFPILRTSEVLVGNRYSRERNILEASLKVEDKKLTVFVNHWKSKRGAESKRMRFALALKKRVKQIGGSEYIILGDLNSNYNEYETFKNRVKLNDTDGRTGINHKLKTLKNGKLITKEEIKKSKNSDYSYNLWLELEPKDRYSYLFYGKHNTLDNIIVPYSMFDGRGIEYIDRSYNKFDKEYLFKKKDWILKWKISKRGNGKHLGIGYSDHLPIYADFK